MDPIIAASLVKGGADVLNNVFGFFGQKDANNANMQLAKYQNEFNLQMWEKQNEYNNPTNTMQRLTDAGINPRAYQQIGQFANATQAQPAVAPQYQSPLSKLQVATSALDAYYDVKMKEEQILNMRAQRDVYKTQALNFDALSRLNSYKGDLSDFELSRLFHFYDVRDAKGDPFISPLFLFPDDTKGIYNNKEKGVSNDAYYRGLIQRLTYLNAKDDQELGILGNGIESIAKGLLLRWPYRFARWTWNIYNNK